MDERIERAGQFYERAVFGGDASGLATADQELDAVEADLTLARGRVAHARFLARREEDPHELALFERALALYRELGDVRGESESLFWVGIWHQVVRDDDEAALPSFEQALTLSKRAGDKLTMSYALRHLGIVAHRAGRLDSARVQLEESVRLRREIGFLPGVAANLVGLAYVAVEQERRDDAVALLDEAAGIAEASDANGITHLIDEARGSLGT